MSKQLTKEEILQSKVQHIMTMTDYNNILSAMTEYADQESEKRAVAFAEWKDKKTYIVNSSSIFLTSEGSVSFDNYSDLYQYFIENIYNK